MHDFWGRLRPKSCNTLHSAVAEVEYTHCSNVSMDVEQLIWAALHRSLRGTAQNKTRMAVYSSRRLLLQESAKTASEARD